MTQQLPSHYHLSVKVGLRGKGLVHFQYLRREGAYQDGARYKDLVATGEGNLPSWAVTNPGYFWEASDRFERLRGSVYREFEVALSRELTPDQWEELVVTFVRQEIDLRHVYQWAIHCPKAALDEGDQPHAHIMFSDRTLDGIERGPQDFFMRANTKHPERGGCKKANVTRSFAHRKADLIALRGRWATLQNECLAKYGHDARVDHRSLVDRGIMRAPERHLGPIVIGRMRSATRRRFLSRREHNRQHDLMSQTPMVDPSFQVGGVQVKRKIGTNAAFSGIELDSKTTILGDVFSQSPLDEESIQTTISNATGEQSAADMVVPGGTQITIPSIEPFGLGVPPGRIPEASGLEKTEREGLPANVKEHKTESPNARSSERLDEARVASEPLVAQPLTTVRIETPRNIRRDVRGRLQNITAASVEMSMRDSVQASKADIQTEAENANGGVTVANVEPYEHFHDVNSADETTQVGQELDFEGAGQDCAQVHDLDQRESNDPEGCEERSDVSNLDDETGSSVKNELRVAQSPPTIRIKTQTQMRRKLQVGLQNITGLSFETSFDSIPKPSKSGIQPGAENGKAMMIVAKDDPSELFHDPESADDTAGNDVGLLYEDPDQDIAQFHEPAQSEPIVPESYEGESDVSDLDDEDVHGFDGP